MSKTQKIIPRGKWVLVRPTEKESRTTNQGLIVPATQEQEQKAYGTVESVGISVDTKDIKKGDQVIYGAFAGENIKINESNGPVEFKLLLDEDIIAFIK
jgi:co-chaperonin GroES (HSP10)